MGAVLIDLGVRFIAPEKVPGPSGVTAAAVRGDRLARGLWGVVRDRVVTRGETVQEPPQYPVGYRRYVSPRYPRQPGGVEVKTGSGAIRYLSSAAFHSKTRHGSYAVSGGMWAGAYVFGGEHVARVVYRGRSEGQDPNVKYYKGRGRVVRAKGKRVSNALKAWTVFEKHGVNALDVRVAEWRSLEEVVRELLSRGLDAALPVRLVWQGRPISAEARRMLAGAGRTGEGAL